MKNKKIIIVLYFIINSLFMISCESDKLIEDNDVEIDIIEVVDLKIKCYLPTNYNHKTPAVLGLPAGGYSITYPQKLYSEWSKIFASKGIAFIVLDYALPGGNPETPINDVMDAINYIYKNSDELNVDINSFGIMGLSAGGHLASIIATRYVAELPIPLSFQVLFFPVISMDGSITHWVSRINFLGENPSNELIQQFSSDKQVSELTPPAYIFVCKDDDIVPPINSILYYEALKNIGISSNLIQFDKGGHGWDYYNSPNKSEIDKMIYWINERLYEDK